MYKFGLKLWSVNTDYYYNEAVRLYEKGVYDYIELYVVPDTIDKISLWQKLKIPFILHAPHFMHGVNLANKDKFEYNQQIYSQVEQYRIALDAKYTIVHSGMEGDINETIRQLKIIKPKDILIENKPYRAPLYERNYCRGYDINEVYQVISKINCGFCLDIGHAICTANSLGKDPYKFVKEFNKLKPQMYHISDGQIDSDLDMHLHFGDGNYDFDKIFSIIDKSKFISIETSKDSKTDLNDFEIDMDFIHAFQKA